MMRVNIARAIIALLTILTPYLSVYYQINEARAEEALPPLQWCDALAEVAQTHAEDMVYRDYVSHISPEGVSAQMRIRQATGQIGTEIIVGWNDLSEIYERIKTSPKHHAALFMDWEYIGVGIADHDIYGNLVVICLSTDADSITWPAIMYFPNTDDYFRWLER